MTAIESISVTELADRCARDPGATVLDVREPEEVAICALPGSVSIPLADLPARFEEIAALPGPVYCLCHHGIRSWHAAAFLVDRGLAACNVSGGIDAWALQVDRSLPRY